MGSFPVKITGWRRISHKRLDFTAAALYDKFPGSTWIGCGFARRWKRRVACLHSFTFHDSSSCQLIQEPSWPISVTGKKPKYSNQIKEQKGNHHKINVLLCNIGDYFFYFGFWISSFIRSAVLQVSVFPSLLHLSHTEKNALVHSQNRYKKWLVIVIVNRNSDAYLPHQVRLKSNPKTFSVT